MATTETRDPELAEAEQTEQTYPTPAPQPVVASAPVPPPPTAAPVPFHPTGPGTGWSGSAAYVSRPPSGPRPDPFADPQYQKQIEQQQLEIYRHAKNVAQAEKDVASARRMLGILSADRMIAGGATPEQAIFKNLHLLTTPGGADYDRGMTSHRMNLPVPKPYGMSITTGGSEIPAIVTPGVGGAQHTQIVPRSAMPQPAFQPKEMTLPSGTEVVQLGPNRFQLKNRPNIQGTPTQLEKVQHEIWKSDLTTLQRAKGKTDDPAQQTAIQTRIEAIESKMLAGAAGAGTKAAPAKGERVKVRKIVDGKVQKMTLPRHQLEQGAKEGWQEVTGGD